MDKIAALEIATNCSDAALEGMGINPKLRPFMLAFGQGKKVSNKLVGSLENPKFRGCFDNYTIIEPKILVNGIECERPETEAPEYDTVIYVAFPTNECGFIKAKWCGYSNQRYWLEQGLVYLNADHAAQRGKAMRLYTEVEG